MLKGSAPATTILLQCIGWGAVALAMGEGWPEPSLVEGPLSELRQPGTRRARAIRGMKNQRMMRKPAHWAIGFGAWVAFSPEPCLELRGPSSPPKIPSRLASFLGVRLAVERVLQHCLARGRGHQGVLQ